MPYIDNVTALALGLEGCPDPSLEVLTQRVHATGYTGYVCPEFTALVEVINEAMEPDPAPIPTIGTVTLTGSTTPTELMPETYTVTIDGDATDVTYVLDSTDAADEVNGMEVTFASGGERTLAVVATSATASDSPVAGRLTVTVAPLNPAPGPDGPAA